MRKSLHTVCLQLLVPVISHACWLDLTPPHIQVPSGLFALPVAAFGGVLLLNALNVPHSKTVSRFKSNFVLLYINILALATDVLIYLGETPVFIGGSRRMWAPPIYIWAPAIGSLMPHRLLTHEPWCNILIWYVGLHVCSTLPLRYIQWAHTTPTMVFMMSLTSDLSYESVSSCFLFINHWSVIMWSIRWSLIYNLSLWVRCHDHISGDHCYGKLF